MPNTPADAQARIALIARMFQAFTAETQVRDGFGRRTFNLQRDAQGEPVVTVYRTRMSTTAARAMTDIQLWNELYTELGTLPNRDNFIDVVFLGMSHWDPATQRLLAHGALGGGRLAMFGGSGLYTWATSLDDLVAHWSDTRMVPLGDDSAGRGTYWANFSTTGFAALHELGHCLSLPHTTEGTKIMNRGFDIMDRTFMPYEPPNLTTPITLEQEAGWDRSAAVRLGFHRFLDLTARTYPSDTPPTIAFASNTLTIASEQGIRHVAYSWDGYVRTHDEFLTTPPPSVTLTAAALRARLPAETPHPAMVDVNAIDAAGNIYSTTISLP
jgi:hypothetical protein